jgi:16S rRNA (guanine527-N7)-methyltransferase
MIAEDILIDALEQLKINFTGNHVVKIKKYLDIVDEFNKKINLIGTKEKQEILIRHFIDCLSIFQYLNNNLINRGPALKILDIGTGAGLPGILLAIIMEDKYFYLLDKKEKVIKFLKEIKRELELNNVEILFGEAESFAHNPGYRESFDLVLARAVGKFNIVCELMLPFCKIRGKAIFYKSKKVFNEIENYSSTISILGGDIEGLFEINVPYLEEYRVLLVINKVKSTLYKYPRKYAKILKTPLL